MQRVGFRLQLKMETLPAYIEHHERVWPEMLAALRSHGWHNYSLFLDQSDGTLFGYFETPNLKQALAGMASEEVNSRWQATMAPYFESLGDRRPDEGFLVLRNVFFLE
jgi:L-rhamnose mutarotase